MSHKNRFNLNVDVGRLADEQLDQVLGRRAPDPEGRVCHEAEQRQADGDDVVVDTALTLICSRVEDKVQVSINLVQQTFLQNKANFQHGQPL